jgi:CHAT domain-containing protein
MRARPGDLVLHPDPGRAHPDPPARLRRSGAAANRRHARHSRPRETARGASRAPAHRRALPPAADHHQLTGPLATRTEVLAAIAAHNWIHLACHARQEQTDPASSGFARWDGSLTISDLAAQPALRPDLAFLSACQTVTGSSRHLDEAIHLAGALQLLGARHVVATMWSISDLAAPKVTDSFYTNLTGPGGPDAARAAASLHDAVLELRDAYPDWPVIWAPYIHLGN